MSSGTWTLKTERDNTMPKSTYELCKMLAERGKLTATMLDLYYAAGHLTEEEYKELAALINP